MTEQVLVTGASGFIATHCIIQLLEKGYKVRGTLRSMGRADEIREIIGKHTDKVGNLTFAEADLTRDDGWKEAATGCPLILHVASPFPLDNPKHEDDLIIPARDGALRLLRAAKDTSARKVVLTSSMAAVMYGHKKEINRPFTEEDWSPDSGPGHSPYTRSKTIAEKAAWAFMKTENPGFGLSVVNPGAVFGPVLENDIGTSAQVIEMMMKGALPGIPPLAFPIVDVRDVADLHIRAMESDAASGKRFICVNGTLWFKDIAALLRENFPEHTKKTPTRVLPGWMLHIAAMLGQFPKSGVRELNKWREGDNTSARNVVGWNPRSAEEATLATAQSMIDLGLV